MSNQNVCLNPAKEVFLFCCSFRSLLKQTVQVVPSLKTLTAQAQHACASHITAQMEVAATKLCSRRTSVKTTMHRCSVCVLLVYQTLFALMQLLFASTEESNNIVQGFVCILQQTAIVVYICDLMLSTARFISRLEWVVPVAMLM